MKQKFRKDHSKKNYQGENPLMLNVQDFLTCLLKKISKGVLFILLINRMEDQWQSTRSNKGHSPEMQEGRKHNINWHFRRAFYTSVSFQSLLSPSVQCSGNTPRFDLVHPFQIKFSLNAGTKITDIVIGSGHWWTDTQPKVNVTPFNQMLEYVRDDM